jgi:hypothetical protein
VCVCVCVCVHTYVYIRMYTYVCIHMYVYTYIYTYRYFLTPSYWALGDPNVTDTVHVIEPSTDIDVLDEEARMQARANTAPCADSAIEIRGLIAEFR